MAQTRSVCEAEEIIDEIADAYIMIQQLAIMYGEGRVIKRTFEKADRLHEMIAGEMAQ